MTYINNIAHIHNDIIRLAKEAGQAKPARPAPPIPTKPSVTPEIAVKPPDADAQSKAQAATMPAPSIPTSVTKNAENANEQAPQATPKEPKQPEVDYKAELKSFEENPDNQPKGINKAFSVFSKAKGIFGDVMNKYAENRLQSFLQGQDKKFRPSMRTKQRTATENYAQQYEEMTGKPIFNRSQLNKDMKILNSMRGEVGEHVKAWYKLQHLKTGKVPKLDQEMINTIAQELTKQNKAKKRAAKANKEEV